MAISKKPLSLLLVIFTTIFLMLLSMVNSSNSISFTFEEFSREDHELIFQGYADVRPENVLQLTPARQDYVGRVLFKEEVHLWSRTTNSLSSFETSINFSLTTPTLDNPGDGFTFFIAPPDSKIPDDSYGGYLGIIDPHNETKNIVVAVEIDTFPNYFDPQNHTHIGIDVHSVKSVNTTRFKRQEGSIGNIRINYDSTTQNLSAVASYPGSHRSEVSYIVDLRTVLPQWVRVGLSASTGDQTEVHRIHSWSFSSTLPAHPPLKEEDMYIASVV